MAARVAFQGERGAYSEMAALRYFQSDIKLLPMKSFQEVFDAVQAGKANFAVVPAENSIEGSVNEVYDLLLSEKISVYGEIYQRVRHCLIAKAGAKMTDIKSVYSHPQALAQCRKYLQRKKLEALAAYDTAGSVKLIKKKRKKNVAAIASKRAAELYGMQILEEGIEDRKNNFTRFLMLADDNPSVTFVYPGDQFKTSIIFSVKHVPGALHGILGEFARRKINLTKIESRPTKETPWEYNFYVDLEGYASSKEIKQALQSVKKKTSFMKILGSYKKAKFG